MGDLKNDIASIVKTETERVLKPLQNEVLDLVSKHETEKLESQKSVADRVHAVVQATENEIELVMRNIDVTREIPGHQEPGSKSTPTNEMDELMNRIMPK